MYSKRMGARRSCRVVEAEDHGSLRESVIFGFSWTEIRLSSGANISARSLAVRLAKPYEGLQVKDFGGVEGKVAAEMEIWVVRSRQRNGKSSTRSFPMRSQVC